MPWIKKGLIFDLQKTKPWSMTHTQVPTALVLKDRIRIYYATRDALGRSLTSFIDLNPHNLSEIIYQSESPILELGDPGTHDQDGVMVGGVIENNSQIFMYYTGWSKEVTVPYRVTIGLAVSNDNGMTFRRMFNGPIVDRDKNEPFQTMSPYILKENDLWHMWYGSGTSWVNIRGKMEPIYVIKYAHSKDGLNWVRENTTCISPSHELEANTRPSVLKTSNGFEMWFSYRDSRDFRTGAGAYRIGYAHSKDGKKWIRESDPTGLSTSSIGWDSKMIAYPNVISLDGKKILFHNGNGFGQTGFGYAVWQD